MIKMTQEDHLKLEIRESQSLAKPRLRGRSRKKGKEANRDRDNIIKKKQTKQISKHDKYSSVLSLSPGGGGYFTNFLVGMRRLDPGTLNL